MEESGRVINFPTLTMASLTVGHVEAGKVIEDMWIGTYVGRYMFRAIYLLPEKWAIFSVVFQFADVVYNRAFRL
jgi:hypothetical protein